MLCYVAGFSSSHHRSICLTGLRRFLSKYNRGRNVVPTCNYDVLGLTPRASQADIKNAYYEKSKQYHPDRNKAPDAETRFREISTAYEILSNEQSRADYDRSRGYFRPRTDSRPKPDSDTSGGGTRRSDFDYTDTIYRRNLYKRMNQAYGTPRPQQSEQEKPKTERKPDPETFNEFDKRRRAQEKFYESLDEELKKKYDELYRRKQQNRQEAEAPAAGTAPSTSPNQTKRSDELSVVGTLTALMLVMLLSGHIGLSLMSDGGSGAGPNSPTLKSKSSSNGD